MKDLELQVVIAEDEPIILHNIVKKVENSLAPARVTGQAQNGRETLSLLAQSLPDLLITDIEMPGMNGLELIEEVRRLYPQIHIVILSGYSSFEYARAGLKYGVDDYLLKPVSQEELNTVLAKASEIIRAEKLRLQRDILAQTLQGLSPGSLVPSSFTDGQFLLILVSLGNLHSRHAGSLPESHLLPFWDRLDLNRFLSTCSGITHFWLIDETQPLRKFIILHTDGSGLHSPLLAMQLKNNVKSSLPSGFPFHILVSSHPIPYQDIQTSARYLRASLPDYAALFHQDAFVCPGAPALPLPDQKSLREQSILLEQAVSSAAIRRYVLDTLHEDIAAGFAQSAADDLIYEAFLALAARCQADRQAGLDAMEEVLSGLAFYQNPAELEKALCSGFQKLQNASSEELGAHNLYAKCRQFIEDNCNMRLTVDDLSARYGYTASYINRLFKKECGMSPLQYQTSLRMEHAKRLLKTRPEMDIRSIAQAIGYEDAGYFSRVFKNELGTTPSEWSRKDN